MVLRPKHLGMSYVKSKFSQSFCLIQTENSTIQYFESEDVNNLFFLAFDFTSRQFVY